MVQQLIERLDEYAIKLVDAPERKFADWANRDALAGHLGSIAYLFAVHHHGGEDVSIALPDIRDGSYRSISVVIDVLAGIIEEYSPVKQIRAAKIIEDVCQRYRKTPSEQQISQVLERFNAMKTSLGARPPLLSFLDTLFEDVCEPLTFPKHPAPGDFPRTPAYERNPPQPPLEPRST